MQILRLLRQRWAIGLMGGLWAAALGLVFLFTLLGDGFRHLSFDLPLALRPSSPISGVVIVYMDEESHQELRQPYKQWDRALHARLIDRLRAEQARLVIYDVFFDLEDTNNLAADERLALAMQQHGRVVLAAQCDELHQAGVLTRTVIPPARRFRESAAGWGLARVEKDPDFGVRRHYPGFKPHVSLPWKAAQIAEADVTRDPSRAWRERWMNYYGPAMGLPSISYHRVLSGDGFAPGFFRDKAVFVGGLPLAGHPGDQKEEFRTPHTWRTRSFSPGVEVVATMFLNLMRGDWLNAIPQPLEIGLLVVFGLSFGYGLVLLRPLSAVLVALLAVIALVLFAFVLVWQFRCWFSWLIVAGVEVPVALVWSIGYDTFRLYVDKRVLQHSLAVHLSPARARQLIKRPELRRPGGEEQTISILFSDIENFSVVTARMHPDDLFKLLNKYFEASLAVIHKHHGTVIKLTGDGIFAVWNAPEAQPGHQKLACQAALDLREQLIQFDARQASLPLRTRVGLHTGSAYVGNVGSLSRFDYTAIGASVNLASRLEGLNKYLGTETLATRSIQKEAEAHVLSRLVGHFRFKGLDEIVEVHELIGPAQPVETPPTWMEAFAAALRSFQRRDFDAAVSSFQRTVQLRGQDGPSRFYLGQVPELKQAALPSSWYGEIELKEK